MSAFSLIGAVALRVVHDSHEEDVALRLFLIFNALWLLFSGISLTVTAPSFSQTMYKLGLVVYTLSTVSIYFYFRWLTTPPLVFRRRDLLHAIAPMIAASSFFEKTVPPVTAMEQYYYPASTSYLSIVNALLLTAYSLRIGSGLLLGFSNLRKSFENLAVSWHRIILLGVANVAVILLWALDKIYSWGLLRELYVLSGSLILMPFFILLNDPQLLYRLRPALANRTYAKSTIGNIDPQKKLVELSERIVQNRLYADETMSLPLMAKHAKLTPHQLSELINSERNENFSSFLHSFRLDEAKRLLVEEPDMRVVEIAYDVGYTSHSAFNRTFKKYVGVSPSEYRRLHREPVDGRPEKSRARPIYGREATRPDRQS